MNFRTKINFCRSVQHPPKIKCYECDFQTENSKEFSTHLKSSHLTEKRYHCDVCDFKTFSYLTLIHHFENICSKTQKLESKCQLCDFSHATDAGIIDHLIKSHVPKNDKIVTKIPLIKLKRV